MVKLLVVLAAAIIPVRADITSSVKIDDIYRATSVTTTTSANVATTSVLIVQANLFRRCLYIWNNSSNSAYITFGPVSSGSTPTAIVPSFTSFVMNAGPIYTGPISAIRNAGTGNMTTTECVP